LLGLQDAETDGGLAPALDSAVAYRAQIHQASGMVAIQLQVSTHEALTRIRAYAFANDLAVELVAAEIVSRRLRLTDDRRNAPGG
jgi:AmiR/NasT family two-component response regulator